MPPPRCNESEAGSRWSSRESIEDAEAPKHLGSAARPNHARICSLRKQDSTKRETVHIYF